MNITMPTWQDFISWPDKQVAAVAPASVVLSFGGSRRSAVLNGIVPHSDAYYQRSRDTMRRCVGLLFQYGVRNVFTNLIVPANLVEFAAFRERFVGWAAEGIAGPEALAYYQHVGWRVRLVTAGEVPEFTEAATVLHTTPPAPQTLWWTVFADDDPWRAVFAAASRTQASNRAEAIQAIYGEEVPLITMLIAFGKPIIADTIIPPLLAGNIQCYWTQRPGGGLDTNLVRRIFYDYAFTRATGSGTDRSTRYEKLLSHRAAWETDSVLGIGQRLGGFWYPEPFPHINEEHSEHVSSVLL